MFRALPLSDCKTIYKSKGNLTVYAMELMVNYTFNRTKTTYYCLVYSTLRMQTESLDQFFDHISKVMDDITNDRPQ